MEVPTDRQRKEEREEGERRRPPPPHHERSTWVVRPPLHLGQEKGIII